MSQFNDNFKQFLIDYNIRQKLVFPQVVQPLDTDDILEQDEPYDRNYLSNLEGQMLDEGLEYLAVNPTTIHIVYNVYDNTDRLIADNLSVAQLYQMIVDEY